MARAGDEIMTARVRCNETFTCCNTLRSSPLIGIVVHHFALPNSVMSPRRKSEKWLLVQWTDGGRDVVSSRCVVKPEDWAEQKITKGVTVLKADGTFAVCDIRGSTRDREALEKQIYPPNFINTLTGPSDKQEDSEYEDFSASGSSWTPSDDDLSTDEDEVTHKQTNRPRRSYAYKTRRKTVILPRRRVHAINKIIYKSKLARRNKSYEQLLCQTVSSQDSIIYCNNCNNKIKIVSEDGAAVEGSQEALTMDEYFRVIGKDKEQEPIEIPEATKHEEEHSEYSDRASSEEFNRSDDNILITNKYENIANNNNTIPINQILTENNKKTSDPTNDTEPKLVHIGSGATVIREDKYKKINWRSYTVATRTLLMAVFPREVLATHSLTGKKSPAFQDKPAKLCLDPKAIADIIIEITDKFNVTESLVRSIITTKCADECKMLKMRLKRKSMPAKSEMKENISPSEDDGDDAANLTC